MRWHCFVNSKKKKKKKSELSCLRPKQYCGLAVVFLIWCHSDSIYAFTVMCRTAQKCIYYVPYDSLSSMLFATYDVVLWHTSKVSVPYVYIGHCLCLWHMKRCWFFTYTRLTTGWFPECCPHLHTPFPLSLISLVVSVDVKRHVCLLARTLPVAIVFNFHNLRHK